MDVTTMNAVALNSVAEFLMTMFGNVNYSFSDSVASGAIVGGCTLLGGLLGGRIGLLVGGGIGTSISSYCVQTIRSLRELIRELNTTQLQNMFALLYEGIKSTIMSMIDQAVNISSLPLETILQQFGSNSLVRTIMIETITKFLSNLHGNGLRRIES